MVFNIVEVDRDYNSVVSEKVMEFEDINSAREWCFRNKWSGGYYYVDLKYEN